MTSPEPTPALTRANLCAFGNVLGPDVMQQSRALFAALQPSPPETVRLDADLACGPDPRHRLDLFTPHDAAPAAGWPVLVFVHGGGFIAGDKTVPGMPFHRNIGWWAAARGWLAANVTYRLAPGTTAPGGAEDVALAIDWIARNAARLGANPNRIVLMGHSAGAAHVAHCVARGLPAGIPIAHAILASGVIEPTTMPAAPWMDAYYGDPRAARHANLPGLAAAAVPLSIIVAEFDPPEFHAQAEAAHAARRAAGQADAPPLVLPNQNHYSTTLHINAEDSAFTRLLASLV